MAAVGDEAKEEAMEADDDEDAEEAAAIRAPSYLETCTNAPKASTKA